MTLFVEFPYNNLAEVLRRQEKYETAEEMHRRALEGREKALEGREKALEGREKALEGREKALGLEHPFTLASVHNLAGDRGKYEAAEDMDR
jgi:hypothetical protein